MAEWKKVIVSGSQAQLAAVTASIAITVGTQPNQTIGTTQATTQLSGSFTGSFKGDGSGLSGVAASFPVTAKTDLATTDQFFINDGASKYVTYGNLVTDLAGSGAGTSNLTTTDTGDSLALTSQIAVTGVTASLLGNASTATTATNATNTAITDTTTGTGPYYITFVDNTTGNLAQRVDSTGLTYNATSNTITATASSAVSASRAVTAATADVATLSTITDTTTGTGPYYLTFVDATSGNVAERIDSTGLTYNATTNTITATASFANRALTASNADLATTATSATNATNTAVTDTTTGTGPYYITFVDTSTGNVGQRVDSTGLTYNATTNTITATASYAAQALSASFASTAPYSGLTGTPSGIVSASVLSSPSQGNAVLTTNGVAGSTIDLGLTTAASPTFVDLTLTGGDLIATTTSTFNLINTNQTTVNFAGAATAVNIGASTGITTINHDARVKGALYVDGPITAISSSNLYVADQFILLASGSAGNTDGGIVIDRGSFAGLNISYGYDSTTGRWGYQAGITDTTNTIDPTGISGSFAAYVFTEASHGATKPTTGEFAKEGASYISTAGDIWIYA